MEILEACMKNPDADDSWPLIDPHTRKVTEVVSAKMLWQKLLLLRMQMGEPYILFVDTANRALPQAQRDAGLRIYQSNLCSEIMLATDELRTAVCCLSSVNMEYFDEWSKDPMFIADMIRMLDNVLEFFIQNAGIIKPAEKKALRQKLREQQETLNLSEDQLEAVATFIEEQYLVGIRRAIHSAKMERSVGLGAMGFHSYLQRRNLPFESAMATSVNRQIFSHIKRSAEKATVKLAQERGACPDSAGEMRRNMHLMAVAPNASSSIICGGTSPSIEPNKANAFTHKTQSGSWLVKNKYLADTLDRYGENSEETWTSILLNKGSVQHLGYLTQDERDIYKTAIELDQRWLVEHAAHRQEYICQGQSVNLFMPATVHVSYLHQTHFMAWKKGLKSLYYMRSEAIKHVDAVSMKVSKQELQNTDDVCLSCEG
jgi:ribonucleoside-diphosphate reductase alpha chain